MDNHAYKGWLNSDKFLKRAFGVAGYFYSAILIIFAGLMALAFIVGFIGALFNY